MANEPCIVCGDDTAAGSPLYSSWSVVARDDARGYVCVDCRAKTSPERRHELSREELARLNESAAVFGAWWSGGTSGIGLG